MNKIPLKKDLIVFLLFFKNSGGDAMLFDAQCTCQHLSCFSQKKKKKLCTFSCMNERFYLHPTYIYLPVHLTRVFISWFKLPNSELISTTKTGNLLSVLKSNWHHSVENFGFKYHDNKVTK